MLDMRTMVVVQRYWEMLLGLEGTPASRRIKALERKNVNEKECPRLLFDDVLTPNPRIKILDLFLDECCHPSTMLHIGDIGSRHIVFDAGDGTALDAFLDHAVVDKMFECPTCQKIWSFCPTGKCFWRWKVADYLDAVQLGRMNRRTAEQRRFEQLENQQPHFVGEIGTETP